MGFLSLTNTDLPPFSRLERFVFWCKRNQENLGPFLGIGEAFIGRHPGPPRLSDVFAIGSKVVEGAMEMVVWSSNADVFKRNGWISFQQNYLLDKQIRLHGSSRGKLESTINEWERHRYDIIKLGRYWVAVNEEDCDAEGWSTAPIDDLIAEIRILVHVQSERWFLGDGEKSSLVEDKSPMGTPGHRCHDISSRLRPYLDRDYARSIMLTGPPGTGKSMLAKQLAMNLCGEYLHIDSRLSSDPNSWNFIRGWKPRCLIIEDFDHAMAGGDLLSQIERQREDTPLLIFTSNSTERIRGAMLRPGRIDLIEEILTPDEVVFDLLSTHIPEEHKERASELFVAYVTEVNCRCEVEGPEQIEEWLSEMEERIDDVGDGWCEEKPAMGGLRSFNRNHDK